MIDRPRERSEQRIDPFTVIAQLGEDGPVARTLGSYEDRPSQRDLAAYISDAFNDGGIALLEAGTGVGKSFAYLVPALAWARANQERTIVSTNTINLQEQLVSKDLPLLRQALSEGEYQPSWALLKGWRNYVCRNRLAGALAAQQSLLEPDKLNELHRLAAWAAQTEDGTLSDFPFQPSAEVWDEVSAEADLCSRQKCRFYDECFVFRARRKAASADVVVVNHHLLAADLAVRQQADNWEDAAVLPPWQRLILDEAHHLEDVAAQHLGVQLSRRGIQRQLQRLERQGRGLLPSLQNELSAADDLLSRASLDLLRDRLFPAVRDAARMTDTLFTRLAVLLPAQGVPQLRLTDEFLTDPIWQEGLTQELDATTDLFRLISNLIDTIAERLKQVEQTERRSQLVNECRAIGPRLAGFVNGLELTLRPPQGRPPEVRWMERTGTRGGNIRLATVPLDLAPVLRDLLFDRARTVAMTSATLSIGGDFSFFMSRVGLSGPGAPPSIQECCASPFDYAAQCLLGVPDNLPEPHQDSAAHGGAVQEVVADLASACDGGLFVLFTSHASLRATAAGLRGELGDQFPILVQGEQTREQLLTSFRQSGRAILLGTDSFWEGVDVPGRALRGLVIAKLPFKVPSEPLTAARLERLAEQGEDGFMSYLLPHASLKLKQGFGRLIRSRNDVGVILLLDPRLVTKRYGGLILSGLPPASRVIGSWQQIRTACEDFFARHGIGAAS